jgi:hypothetical protein
MIQPKKLFRSKSIESITSVKPKEFELQTSKRAELKHTPNKGVPCLTPFKARKMPDFSIIKNVTPSCSTPKPLT